MPSGGVASTGTQQLGSSQGYHLAIHAGHWWPGSHGQGTGNSKAWPSFWCHPRAQASPSLQLPFVWPTVADTPHLLGTPASLWEDTPTAQLRAGQLPSAPPCLSYLPEAGSGPSLCGPGPPYPQLCSTSCFHLAPPHPNRVQLLPALVGNCQLLDVPTLQTQPVLNRPSLPAHTISQCIQAVVLATQAGLDCACSSAQAMGWGTTHQL